MICENKACVEHDKEYVSGCSRFALIKSVEICPARLWAEKKWREIKEEAGK